MKYLLLSLIALLTSACMVNRTHTRQWYTNKYNKIERQRDSRRYHKTNAWYKEHNVKRK